MAQLLGITRSRLASYEYGRAPVRFEIADLFCSVFLINQRWLAEGKAPLTYYVPMERYVEQEIEGKMLFSEAYKRYLQPDLNKHLAAIATGAGIRVSEIRSEQWQEITSAARRIGHKPIRTLVSALQFAIADAAEKLPEKLYVPFLKTVQGSLDSFLSAHYSEVKHDLIYLANETETDSLHDVPTESLWSGLLGRLDRLTKGRGQRSRLAEDVGLTRQAISKWFAGRGEPSAEVALKAMAWADREEKKRKRK